MSCDVTRLTDDKVDDWNGEEEDETDDAAN